MKWTRVIEPARSVGFSFAPAFHVRAAVEHYFPKVEIRSLSFRNSTGEVRPVYKTGEPLIAVVEFETHEPVKDAAFGIILFYPRWPSPL